MKDGKPTLWEKLQLLMYNLAFPTMTERRLKVLLWYGVNFPKYIAWVVGVGIGGLIIGVCIAQGNGIAFSILFGVFMGALSFGIGRLVARWWLKYFLPAHLEMEGIEPAQLDAQHRVEPVTNVGRKAYWVYFVCLLVFGFVFYIGLAYHFLGVWGIPLAVVFCLLSTWFLWWRWKKVKSKGGK